MRFYLKVLGSLVREMEGFGFLRVMDQILVMVLCTFMENWVGEVFSFWVRFFNMGSVRVGLLC